MFGFLKLRSGDGSGQTAEQLERSTSAEQNPPPADVNSQIHSLRLKLEIPNQKARKPPSELGIPPVSFRIFDFGFWALQPWGWPPRWGPF